MSFLNVPFPRTGSKTRPVALSTVSSHVDDVGFPGTRKVEGGGGVRGTYYQSEVDLGTNP